MKSVVRAAIMFLVFLPDAVSANSKERPSRELVAEAVSTLASMDWEVDIDHLAELLKLPNLPETIRWIGPSSRNESPHFSAYYDPRSSIFGITKISIQWTIGMLPDLAPKMGVFNNLLIVFDSKSCPSESVMTKAIGRKALHITAPGYDGGPSYPTTSFSIPQKNGPAVIVSFIGNDACRVNVSRSREW